MKLGTSETAKAAAKHMRNVHRLVVCYFRQKTKLDGAEQVVKNSMRDVALAAMIDRPTNWKRMNVEVQEEPSEREKNTFPCYMFMLMLACLHACCCWGVYFSWVLVWLAANSKKQQQQQQKLRVNEGYLILN